MTIRDEETEDLPGFSPPREGPGPDTLDPEATAISSHPSQTGEGRPTITGHDVDSSEAEPPRPSRPPSSTTSSEEVDEALAGYGTTGFMVATAALNKFMEQRTRQRTTRWLATEDEAQAFGDALGRIASRKVPAELVEKGDTADLLIMGDVLFGYGARTILNLSPDEAVAAAQAWVEEQAAQAKRPEEGPQQGTPPPTAPPPRSVQVEEDVPTTGTATAPASPPLSVITPSL
jgi:hypothetical protein